jgi:ferredoxin-NADP reductase
MPKCNVKLLKKESVAEGTMAFHFEKPQGFEYRAGQFGDFTLINPPETDAEGNTRGFSLAGAPDDPDLMIATRMRDTAFKRVLKNLPVGTEIVLDAPYGDFTLHKTQTTPAVYLTGGIGITPVRSIIASATRQKSLHQITLFYANRTPQSAAFTVDLQAFAAQNPNFTFVPVIAEGGTMAENGETGLINRAMLEKHLPSLQAPIYYLSGPAIMVTAMRKILTDAGVNEDNIRTEEFSGY